MLKNLGVFYESVGDDWQKSRRFLEVESNLSVLDLSLGNFNKDIRRVENLYEAK
ncbi:hypothetical protein HMPREF9999_02281 [Alloprevotella sp. oral taxon 473 str. F0040]|nr:hypothetical protein HMPREF9999_02281 [Alloprevotella sp. oral taxon 473 str. F0040]